MKCETNLEEGLKKVRASKRPGMVIIHKSTCSVCRKLKPRFLASKDIARLSQRFVVISLEDEAEPKDRLWLPDGKYFPRIFFVNPNGRVMMEVTNADGNPTYKYFYQNEGNLLRSMEKVLRAFPDLAPGPTQGKSPNRPQAMKNQVRH